MRQLLLPVPIIARLTRYAIILIGTGIILFLSKSRLTGYARDNGITAESGTVKEIRDGLNELGENPQENTTANKEVGRNETTRSLKIILLWNPFFGEPDYGVGGFGKVAFERTSCKHTCWLTNDKSQLPYADAVVVHVYNMGPAFQNATMPKRQNRKQIFVFFILESPLRSFNGFQGTGFSFRDTFNLTFTFLDADDTDVYIPMGGVQRREKPLPGLVPQPESVANKSLVAWFVSNCNAPSHRMEYAEELAKHVPVHIYGQCGNYSCPPGEFQCYSRVIQSYMFYLAFENSFCLDYVTEKFFRTLTTPMVPIVYGYANYTKLLPYKSFIDVRDFKSPKHLARYLIRLKEHPEKYVEYLSWRENYSVLKEGDMKTVGFCKLCSILHRKHYAYKSNYDPVMDYWNPDKLCLTGSEERQAVHLDENEV